MAVLGEVLVDFAAELRVLRLPGQLAALSLASACGRGPASVVLFSGAVTRE